MRTKGERFSGDFDEAPASRAGIGVPTIMISSCADLRVILQA
jgi:hypothetical protein